MMQLEDRLQQHFDDQDGLVDIPTGSLDSVRARAHTRTRNRQIITAAAAVLVALIGAAGISRLVSTSDVTQVDTVEDVDDMQGSTSLGPWSSSSTNFEYVTDSAWTGDRFLAAHQPLEADFAADSGAVIYRSTDDGDWEAAQVLSESVMNPGLWSDGDGTVLAWESGGAFEFGVKTIYRSTNHGDTFFEAATVQFEDSADLPTVKMISAAVELDNTIWVFTEEFLIDESAVASEEVLDDFANGNRLTVWTKEVNVGSREVTKVASFSAGQVVPFVLNDQVMVPSLSRDQNLLLSFSNGSSEWVETPLPGDVADIQPGPDGTLFGIQVGGGTVQRSTDGGATWQTFAATDGAETVDRIVVGSRGVLLVAARFGSPSIAWLSHTSGATATTVEWQPLTGLWGVDVDSDQLQHPDTKLLVGDDEVAVLLPPASLHANGVEPAQDDNGTADGSVSEPDPSTLAAPDRYHVFVAEIQR